MCALCGIGAIGGGLFFWNKVSPIAGCMLNFQAVESGMQDYLRANNNKFPKAETWQNDIKKYVGKYLTSEETGPIKAMDVNGTWHCESDGIKTGIAFNSALSGKNVADITDQSTTVMIFEIETPRMNAAEPYKARDINTSPMIFGDHRGWLTISVNGTRGGMKSNRSKNDFNWEIDTDQGSEKPQGK